MNQERLEDKARTLFEEQGFQVENKAGNRYSARKEDEGIDYRVFSSQEYSEEDVRKYRESNEKIFVDEGFSDLKDILGSRLSVLKSPNRKKCYDLPSYEVIGDIAVINDIQDYEEENVVEGILYYNAHIESILVKESSLSGEYRVGDYRVIFGEKTETIHKEHGCRFKVDPTKVYFSERFSAERKRVFEKVEKGERVLVMFAGVGPFAIQAAVNRDPEKVVGVEKNPEAVKYFRENVLLNNVQEKVEVIEGDVSEASELIKEKFDRIIMPLPGMAKEYLDLAVSLAKKESVIHLYTFVEDEKYEEEVEEILDRIDSEETEFEVLDRVNCGDRSPYEERMCFDLKVLQDC